MIRWIKRLISGPALEKAVPIEPPPDSQYLTPVTMALELLSKSRDPNDAVTGHDLFLCAALFGILAHPTCYRDICLQAQCDGRVPGEVALQRAIEWADHTLAECERRAASQYEPEPPLYMYGVTGEEDA